MLIIKGAVIVLLFLVFMFCLVGSIAIAAEEDRQQEFTDEDISQMRFNYAHYEEDDIEN